MEEYNNVMIEAEDGTKREYSVLAVFEVGGQSYVALLPLQDEDEIVFYGCNENTDRKELELIEIESEEEFAVVSESFINLMGEIAENAGKQGE